LTTPTPTQTSPSATANATGDIFFGISLPQKGRQGGVGARAAAEAKIRRCRSSTSSSAPGETRKIQPRDQIGFAPVDLLSTTQRTRGLITRLESFTAPKMIFEENSHQH
jgi:hypothetical protein